jgi:hypothetical protein
VPIDDVSFEAASISGYENVEIGAPGLLKRVGASSHPRRLTISD